MTRNTHPATPAGTTDDPSAPATDDGATDESATDDPPATRRLQFLQSATPPAVEPTVYAETTARLLGESVQFCVIGNSHAVAAPGLDYYELSSCEPVGGGERVRLAPDERRRRLRFESPSVVAETVVDPRPLAAFPDGESFLLAHEFPLSGDGHAADAAGPGAVTTLDTLADGFETYHTYPEFDLALYTRTTLEPRE